MSVKEGRSVSLHADVTELQKDDVIEWRFGPQNTVIAEIKGGKDKLYDGDDERFKNKLKLNKRTGSFTDKLKIWKKDTVCLTISDITTDHSGLYELKSIRRGKTFYKRFRLTVKGE